MGNLDMSGINEIVYGNGDVLRIDYDEFNEVYGCHVKGHKDRMMRCYDCDWEGCPARGGRRT